MNVKWKNKNYFFFLDYLKLFPGLTCLGGVEGASESEYREFRFLSSPPTNNQLINQPNINPSLTQCIHISICRSINQSNNESIKQSINLSISQSIYQSNNHSQNQSIHLSINQYIWAPSLVTHLVSYRGSMECT